ncbi:hypothetical protein E2C01_002265 [Portunus trituberculatus]|uniref:Uncharacterized protein n=1 Tax=Portunus trituberculatus TaxID=210409 RepID=A0A5B7CJH2_PORTR|nr:hypothetical protein [Portunus trituberculatus]
MGESNVHVQLSRCIQYWFSVTMASDEPLGVGEAASTTRHSAAGRGAAVAWTCHYLEENSSIY